METFSFKISSTEDQALNILANRWGCNRAEAARRSLQLSQKITDSAVNLAQNPDRLQELIEGQQKAVELLDELVKSKSIATQLNRIEEYCVQAVLSSGMLAKQAGVFETARNEFTNWKQQRRESI